MGVLGYSLIAIGLALLVFTFILGYGLYMSFSSSSTGYMPTAQASANVSSAVSTLTNSINQSVRDSVYMLLEIVVLFLFASIGYKIAYLGVSLLKGEKPEKQK
ncbi:MAG: hypothetical protein ACP5K9_02615 [Candidatus Micrarchaeia archaeon]